MKLLEETPGGKFNQARGREQATIEEDLLNGAESLGTLSVPQVL